MNPLCPRCGASGSIKFGRFYRSEDSQSIQRYWCTACSKCHSSATHTPTYRQKRRRLNRLIEMDIGSSTAQRVLRLNTDVIVKPLPEKWFFSPRKRARKPRSGWNEMARSTRCSGTCQQQRSQPVRSLPRIMLRSLTNSLN